MTRNDLIKKIRFTAIEKKQLERELGIDKKYHCIGCCDEFYPVETMLVDEKREGCLCDCCYKIIAGLNSQIFEKTN